MKGRIPLFFLPGEDGVHRDDGRVRAEGRAQPHRVSREEGEGRHIQMRGRSLRHMQIRVHTLTIVTLFSALRTFL